MVIGTLPNGQVRKRGKKWFKPVLNTHTTIQTKLIPFFLFIPLQLSSQKNFLGRKNIGRAFAPIAPPLPPFQVTPMTEGLYIIYINFLLKTFKPFST